jgi:hypothetical protein
VFQVSATSEKRKKERNANLAKKTEKNPVLPFAVCLKAFCEIPGLKNKIRKRTHNIFYTQYNKPVIDQTETTWVAAPTQHLEQLECSRCEPNLS